LREAQRSLVYLTFIPFCYHVPAQGNSVLEKENQNMRHIYIYDPEKMRIVEAQDVTNASEADCERIRLDMLMRCKFPCDVVDSLEQSRLGIDRATVPGCNRL
jgi:hypothetical protein